MDREDRRKLYKAFKRLGHENPDQSVYNLIQDLNEKGQFMYVAHPHRVHRGNYQASRAEPIQIRLFKN